MVVCTLETGEDDLVLEEGVVAKELGNDILDAIYLFLLFLFLVLGESSKSSINSLAESSKDNSSDSSLLSEFATEVLSTSGVDSEQVRVL